MLRGAGVAMALPWLESIPVWGARGGRRCGRRLPQSGWRHDSQALRRAVHGQRHQPQSLVGQGRRRRNGTGQSLEPMAPFKTKMNVIRGLFNKRHRRGHPSRPDRQILSGASAAKGRRAARRHQHGPGAGQSPRRRDDAAEPGAGLRTADHRLSRDEFLDGLQLAHLLAKRDLAGADGGLSVAGVRQPVRQPRQHAEQKHSGPRAGTGRQSEPASQRQPTRRSSTNT